MAQCRVEVLQHEAVFLRIGTLDFRLLGIRFHVAVYHRQNLCAVVYVRPFHITAQARPVFRLVIGPDDTVCKVVKLPYVFLECGGTPDGKVGIVLVGAFGRGKTFQPHGRDGDVLVIAHGVDGRLYLAQLDRVAAVVGIDLRPVHRKVDICRTGKGTALHDLGLGLHEYQFGEERLAVPSQQSFVFRQYLLTAAPVAAVEFERGPVHPFLVGNMVVIPQQFRFVRCLERLFRITRNGADSIPYIIVISAVSVDAYRRQVNRIRRIDQSRGEQYGTVGVHIKLRQIYIHRNGQVLAIAICILSHRFRHTCHAKQGCQYEYHPFHFTVN